LTRRSYTDRAKPFAANFRIVLRLLTAHGLHRPSELHWRRSVLTMSTIVRFGIGIQRVNWLLLGLQRAGQHDKAKTVRYYKKSTRAGTVIDVYNSVKAIFHWDHFLVTSLTSSRTCWWRRQLPRNKSITSWRLPRDICGAEVTRNWSQWNLEFGFK